MSTEHANATVHEDLSALVDGELDRSRTAFLMRRLEHDTPLRACFGRYQLIGDCLRGRSGLPAYGDTLAARIAHAVAAEARPARPLPWRAGVQWAAGFFTAALVAAGAFWYVQPSPGAADLAAAGTIDASSVTSSGVRADDLRRQLPLLPVSARQSQPVQGQFAPRPDPEAWQRAPVLPMQLPSTHYIILVPGPAPAAPPAAESPR
ncbi:MAG: hypothetical protein KF823_04540 [Xanthomonadales bacterium]|nr:hypothetical protein [Xanthomonadales bacterium]